MLTFVLILAIPLEILRLIFLCQDMRELAIEKGESPGKWILYTLLVWPGIELTSVAIWYYFKGMHLLIGGLFIGISLAHLVHRVVKYQLNQKTDLHWENKIDEIGK